MSHELFEPYGEPEVRRDNRPVWLPDPIPGDREWMVRGRCATDPDAPSLFFAESARDNGAGGTASTAEPQIRRALLLCAVCCVRQTCLDYALDYEIWHGVWGGMRQTDRRRLIRFRRKERRSA